MAVPNVNSGDERRELRVVAADRLDGAVVPLAALAHLKQPLGLVVHHDDVRLVVGHEDRVGDVLEDEVQAVTLARRVELGQADALHLSLELVAGASQVRDVAQHRQDSARPFRLAAQRMREHLEQEVGALAGVDEVELARPALEPAGHHGAREVRGEQQVVHLDGATTPLGVRVARVEQTLGPRVLHDDVVRRVRDDDRVGQRVDDAR